MAGADLSAWVAKPPPRSKDPTAMVQEAESLGQNTESNSPHPESVSANDMSASPREGSQTHSKPDTLSPAEQTHFTNDFYIDVPAPSDREEYEHLPGYFTVRRILQEVTPARYLVKLRSGEVDLVSLSRIQTSLTCPLPSFTLILPFPWAPQHKAFIQR